MSGTFYFIRTNDAKLSYSLNEEGEYTEELPTFINVGVKTVYYKVERNNYHTVYGSVLGQLSF